MTILNQSHDNQTHKASPAVALDLANPDPVAVLKFAAALGRIIGHHLATTSRVANGNDRVRENHIA